MKNTSVTKLSARDEIAKTLLIEILSDQFTLDFKRMFGCYGVYADQKLFFAIISEGTIYFKTDAPLAALMIARAAVKIPFLKNYHSLSIDILEDEGVVKNLARRSISICMEKTSNDKKMTKKRKTEFLCKVQKSRKA